MIAPRPSQLQEDRVEEEPKPSAEATSDESRVEELPAEGGKPGKEGQPRVEKEDQKSPGDSASVTKMYRITTVPMARQAMEEVLRAVKAEETKPLAFLGSLTHTGMTHHHTSSMDWLSWP